MKAAIIYTRVSTTRQAEEGVSLDAQTARCRDYCAGLGYEVAGEFQDAGLSGGRADNRPGLQAALDKVTKSGGILVTYSLSRLARSTRDALDMAERLDKAGADLVSLSESIDTTSAAGKMIFRMLAVLSEFERDLVSERTKAALSHKRACGYKTGGPVPFGFDADSTGKLTKNRNEQKAIKLIHKLRGEGSTLRAIAAELQKRGILTRAGRVKWQPSAINKILKRAA